METNQGGIMRYNKVKDEGTILSIFQDLPFPPKRIYYMQEMDRYEERGFHKHKKNRQVLICVKGEFGLRINKSWGYFYQDEYVILEPSDWHEMSNFSSDCIILVLASEEYDKDDYIR